MNKVILIGRLTADPEMRSTQGGTDVANYRLAVDRRFKREGEPDADFINCVTFSKAAEFAGKYLRKGVKIAVEGRMQTRTYETNSGEKRFVTEVVVENHFFCESKQSSSDTSEQAGWIDRAAAAVPFEELADDDIPF